MNTYNGKPVEVFTSSNEKELDAKFNQLLAARGQYDTVTRSGNKITAYPSA